MAVGRWHDGRHDVVVVPAAEVLVLQKGAVVRPVVETSGKRSVEHPAGMAPGGGGGGRHLTVRIAENAENLYRDIPAVPGRNIADCIECKEQ